MIQSRLHRRLIGSVATAAVLINWASVRAVDQPANPSFSGTSDIDALNPPLTQFGTFRQGNPGATLNLNVYNLPAASGTTSAMSLAHTPFKIGDTSAIELQPVDLDIDALEPVGPGGTPRVPIQLVFSTSQLGNIAASYTLEFSSDSLPTALHKSLSIAAYATVLRHGDYNADGKVDGGDYAVWRKTRGQTVPAYSRADDNGDGQVTDADYNAWRTAFTGASGSGSSDLSRPVGVPEPTTAILGLVGAAFAAVMRTRKRSRA